MLHTDNLAYAYSSSQELRFPDLHCASNEHWLLLGQSGSGKTTLLHLLGGLLTPKSGMIRVKDTELNRLSGAQLDRFRGRNIGIIFQQSHFVPALNVEENLMLAQHLAGVPANSQRIKELLEQLSISHKLRKSVNALSVGEQQRVAIARALVNRPDVILADEPTSALDDENSERVVELLEEQANAVGATLLIVTHDTRLKDRFPQQILLERQTPAV